jgi:hypothetical protein
MTNLEVIKYLATNKPARLAELLEDIYCCAWNDGANDKLGDESSIPNFDKWIYEDAAKSGMHYNYELEQWSKAINNPSIEITYPDNLVINLPFEGKDPNHMWNTDNNFHIIGQAIDEIKLLETIIESEKYSSEVYNRFRKEVCVECPCQECIQSQMDIVECPKFENYKENN